MMQREKLQEMKVEELRTICKENGISCYENGKRMNKTALIERLMGTGSNGKNDKKDTKSNNKEAEQVEQSVDTAEVSAEELEAIEAKRKEMKMKYIVNAEIGQIVAFRIPETGKVISAMITKKSTKKQKFAVETQYGVEHIVLWEDVIWVRTGKRWPRGIYQLFKKNLEPAKGVEDKDGEKVG